jgi:hypothetical protein
MDPAHVLLHRSTFSTELNMLYNSRLQGWQPGKHYSFSSIEVLCLQRTIYSSFVAAANVKKIRKYRPISDVELP